jgi:hypothetical protein
VLAVVLGTMEMGGLCSGTAPQLRDVHARSGSGAVKEGRASCGVGTQERPQKRVCVHAFRNTSQQRAWCRQIRDDGAADRGMQYAMHGKHAGLSAGPVSR